MVEAAGISCFKWLYLSMEIKISIDESSEKGKRVLQLLKKLGINYSALKIGPKEAAFGIGRPATDAELDEYLKKCLEGQTFDIDDLINETTN